MNKNKINIGDYVTVFTIPRGYVIAQVIDIVENSRYNSGYAVKVQFKFNDNLQSIKENITSNTDLGNIEPIEKVLDMVKNKINKLSENLRLAQETIGLEVYTWQIGKLSHLVNINVKTLIVYMICSIYNGL